MSSNTVSMTDLKRAPGTAIAPTVEPGFGDMQSFELMQRIAKIFNLSELVPKIYQGPEGLSSTIIALNMALRMRADPLMVMQNLYVVHGRPAWSAQFLIACFNQNGRFSAIRYRWQGKQGDADWGCRAYAAELRTGEEIVGPLVTMATAKAEGWIDRTGSKWKTIPELMLTYRAAAWMIRTHAPEIAMGLPTAEEAGDVYDVTPTREPLTTAGIGEGAHVMAADTGMAEMPAAVTFPTIAGSGQGGAIIGDGPPLSAILQLETKMRAAHAKKDADLLDVHADLIKTLPETAQAPATALYKRLRAEIVPE